MRAALLALAIPLASCGAAAPVVTPPPEPPPTPTRRPAFNPDDVVPSTLAERDEGVHAPARPVFQRALRRGPSQGTAAVAWTRDGSRVVVGSNNGELAVFDTETGEIRAWQRPYVRAIEYELSFDASGSRVLAAGMSSALLWDLRTDRVRVVPEDALGNIATRALMPNGEQLVVVGVTTPPRATVTLADLRSGEPVASTSFELTSRVSPRLYPTPSGRRILVHIGQDAVLLDAATLAIIERWSNVSLTAMRDRGGAFALAGSHGVSVHDSLTGAVRRRTERAYDLQDLDDFWFSAAGDHLILQGSHGAFVLDLDTLEQISVVPTPYGPVALVPVTPDETSAADAATSEFDDAEAPMTNRGEPFDAVFSPHGTDGPFVRAGLSDPDSARRLLEQAEDEPPEGHVSIGPDGVSILLVTDRLRLYRADTQTVVWTQHSDGAGQHSMWGADFRADGGAIYTRGRPGVDVWSADTFAALPCGNESPPQRLSDGRLVQLDMRCPFEGGHAGGRGVHLNGQVRLVTDRQGARIVDLVRDRTRPLRPSACEGQRCSASSAFSADGRLVVVVTRIRRERGQPRLPHQTVVEVHDTATGRRRYRAVLEGRSRGRPAVTARHTLIPMAGRVVVLNNRGRQTAEYPSDGYGFAWDPTLELFAFSSTATEVTIVHAPTATVRARLPFTGDLRSASLGSGGSHVVLETDDALRVFEMSGALVYELTKQRYDRVALSHDGQVALRCRAGELTWWHTVTREEATGRCGLGALSLSRDGAFVAETDGANVHVTRLADGARLTLRVLRDGANTARIAHDDQGRWDGVVPEPSLVRMRARGSADLANLSPWDMSTRTEGLVGMFLAGG